MIIQMDLPSATEGGWKVLDETGKVVAKSEDLPGASLLIEPYFYKGAHTQHVVSVHTSGESGRKVKQMMRVLANSGRVRIEDLGKAPKRIKAAFDTLSYNKAKETPK